MRTSKRVTTVATLGLSISQSMPSQHTMNAAICRRLRTQGIDVDRRGCARACVSFNQRQVTTSQHNMTVMSMAEVDGGRGLPRGREGVNQRDSN